MTPTMTMAFQVIMQMADKLPEEVFNFIDDKKVALMIMRASPEERFALFFGRYRFRVHGLSSTMAKAMEFQKIMGFLQAVSVSPIFMQAFMQRFSANKFMDQILAALNLNPKNFERSEEELETLGAEMEGAGGMAQLLGGGPKNAEGQPGGMQSGAAAGGSPEASAIQRRAQPGAQIPGNA